MSLAVVQRAIGEAARLVKSRAVRAIVALGVPIVPISAVSRLEHVGSNRMFGSYYTLWSPSGEYPADYLNHCFELFCDTNSHDLNHAFANTNIPQFNEELELIIRQVVSTLDLLNDCDKFNITTYERLAQYGRV